LGYIFHQTLKVITLFFLHTWVFCPNFSHLH
jgi:hypothetical protein